MKLLARAWTRPVLGCVTVLTCGVGAGGADDLAAADTSDHQRAAARHAITASIPSGDWTRFNYDAARSGIGPADTGITARNLSSLRLRRVRLDGTVDSSPIELHALRVAGRFHDVIVVTTTYGRTVAIDAGTGHRLWQYVPPDIHAYEGSAQITDTTPVADRGRRYVYAPSPDGRIRKLVLATGREVRSGHWPVRVTLDASHEKLAAALNLSGRQVIAVTGGYLGDAPPYQGHVVGIDRVTGRILHVWNSLCSDRHRLLIPRRCPASDSAIWARSGAVVEPRTGRLLVATGNAEGRRPFDGVANWSNSVLELTPDAARLLHNWTPVDQARLSASDGDIGSTAPALLPPGSGRRLAVQGGKDGKLRLLDLARLNGTRGGPSARLGGELQDVGTPGGSELFTAPLAWTHSGTVHVFLANGSGTAEYVLRGGRRPRLRLVTENAAAGTSPVLAGGLLYVFDPAGGAVRVYAPSGLRPLASLPAARGHWNSPIVIAGRVIVPEGDANDHASSGTLDIYHLPGR